MKRFGHARAIVTKLLGAVFALVLAFSFLPTAHAEEARIVITATPTELEDSGNVTFTFEINNYNADYPMTDILINYNGTDYNVLQGVSIAPSSQINNISLTLPVSQSQLGKPITFLFTWVRNGEPMSQEAQYTIAQADNPIITVTRTADKTNAKPGDKVTITYTIKNTTKFDMTDIMLIDENISDMPIFQNETLRASRTMSYDFPYTMGEESVTSTPLVTYTVNGKTKTFSSLEPLELTMVRIQLDLDIKAGTPTSTGVTFTLDVTNSGTQDISNIMITDERANPVNDTAFNLAAGESRSLSYVVVPLMTEPLRNVQFSLTGIDPFGEAYEIKPTEEDIFPVLMPVAYGTETAAPATPTPVQTDGAKFTIFSGISNGIATILIILGVLMVFSVIVLIVLSAMERARAPRRGYFDEIDDDDILEPHTTHHASKGSYHDTPDPEEIRYTQRMFSAKEEEPPKQEPIRLPAPQTRLSDQPQVIFAQRQPEPIPEQEPQRAEELAHRLVETARTRYSEAQSAASYRPASEAVKPYLEPQKRQEQAVPRVLNYKKEPKTQRLEKQPVLRVQKSAHYDTDDEE